VVTLAGRKPVEINRKLTGDAAFEAVPEGANAVHGYNRDSSIRSSLMENAHQRHFASFRHFALPRFAAWASHFRGFRGTEILFDVGVH
jgi:hypothetical protein